MVSDKTAIDLIGNKALLPLTSHCFFIIINNWAFAIYMRSGQASRPKPSLFVGLMVGEVLWLWARDLLDGADVGKHHLQQGK